VLQPLTCVPGIGRQTDSDLKCREVGCDRPSWQRFADAGRRWGGVAAVPTGPASANLCQSCCDPSLVLGRRPLRGTSDLARGARPGVPAACIALNVISAVVFGGQQFPGSDGTRTRTRRASNRARAEDGGRILHRPIKAGGMQRSSRRYDRGKVCRAMVWEVLPIARSIEPSGR
jgi:hypothetical protein